MDSKLAASCTFPLPVTARCTLLSPLPVTGRCPLRPIACCCLSHVAHFSCPLCITLAHGTWFAQPVARTPLQSVAHRVARFPQSFARSIAQSVWLGAPWAAPALAQEPEKRRCLNTFVISSAPAALSGRNALLGNAYGRVDSGHCISAEDSLVQVHMYDMVEYSKNDLFH